MMTPITFIHMNKDGTVYDHQTVDVVLSNNIPTQVFQQVIDDEDDRVEIINDLLTRCKSTIFGYVVVDEETIYLIVL